MRSVGLAKKLTVLGVACVASIGVRAETDPPPGAEGRHCVIPLAPVMERLPAILNEPRPTRPDRRAAEPSEVLTDEVGRPVEDGRSSLADGSLSLSEWAAGMARVLDHEHMELARNLREERGPGSPRPDPRVEPEDTPILPARPPVTELEGLRPRPRTRSDATAATTGERRSSSQPVREERSANLRSDPRAEPDDGAPGARVNPVAVTERPPPNWSVPPPDHLPRESGPTHEADRRYREVAPEGGRLTEADYVEMRRSRESRRPEADEPDPEERRRLTSSPPRGTYRPPRGGRASAPTGVIETIAAPERRASGLVSILGRAYRYTLSALGYRLPPYGQTAEVTLRNAVTEGLRIRSPTTGESVRITEVLENVGEGGFRTSFRVRGEDGVTYVAQVMDPTRTVLAGMTLRQMVTSLRNARDLVAPLRAAAADLSRTVSAATGLRVEYVVQGSLADNAARNLGITVEPDLSSASLLSPAAERALRARGYGEALDGYESLGLSANEGYLATFLDPEVRRDMFADGVPNRPNFRTGYAEPAFPDIRRGSIRGIFNNTLYRFLPDGTLQIIARDPF